MAFDTQGNLYVADYFNNRIRKIDISSGLISTVAGGGTRRLRDADGFPATEARLYYPSGIVIDSQNNVYFTEEGNNLVRRLSGGILTTVAGSGDRGYSGDGGPAGSARLAGPQGIVLDQAGNLLIADSLNNRLRTVLSAAPTFDTDAATLTITGASAGSLSPSQTVGLTSSLVGLGFTVKADADWLKLSTSGGAMPATLNVSADPASLLPGTFKTTLTITAPGAKVPVRTLPVTFNVTAPAAPQMSVNRKSLDFAVPQGASSTITLQIANTGSGSLDFTAADTGQNSWLKIASPTSARPGLPAPLDVTVNTGDLAPGTYRTQIAVTGPATSGQPAVISVPVTLTVTESRPRMLLAQTGLRFVAVAGGGTPLPQTFGVLNAGSGSLDFSLDSSTLAGSSWLKPSMASASTDATKASLVRVAVDPSSLTPGDYYGMVRLNSPSAVNSPQIVPVLMTVLASGATPGPELDRASVVFSSSPGVSPGSETVLVANLTGKPLTYVSSKPGPDNWLTAAPSSGAIQPGEYGRIVIQPDYALLGPGVSQSRVTLSFSDGTIRNVDIVALVSPNGPSDSLKGADRGAGCDVKTLQPKFTAPADNFLAPLLAPVTLRLQIYDNCGNQILDSSTSVLGILFDETGKSYDADIQFQPVGGGEWRGTFTPQKTGNKVRLRGLAVKNTLSGLTDLNAILLPAGTVVPPVVTKGSAQNAATLETTNVVAPGGLITIRGSGFSDSVREAKGLPLPVDSDGTQVFLQGRQLALLYTSDGQINAQVPYDLTVNAPQQLIVQRKATLMLNPEILNVAPAQPGILAVNEAGTGQGFVYVVKGNGSRVLADSSAPAKAGDRIVILAAGLGVTSPAVAAGQQPPDNPRASVVNPVAVSIGGAPVAVESATLSPDSDKSGRYEIVCTLPAGISPGSTVPVVVVSAAQSSPATVTIAVQ